MEKRTLNFSSSGFVYDVENPTRYTEELSFMLLGALNGASDISIRSGDDTETQAILDGEQTFLAIAFGDKLDSLKDELTTLAGHIDEIKDVFAQIGYALPADGAEGYEEFVAWQGDQVCSNTHNIWYHTYLCTQEVKRCADQITEILAQMNDPENSELLRAAYAIAASNGFFVNTPGRISIEQVVEP